jgi:hypothetical protein
LIEKPFCPKQNKTKPNKTNDFNHFDLKIIMSKQE